MIEVVLALLVCAVSLFLFYFFNLEPSDQDALRRSAKRNVCYYMPSDFTVGAVGFAGDRVHAPTVLELLSLSAGQVAETLGLADKKHARKVIDAIVRVLHDEFQPGEIYVGGSFKKGTALRTRSDIDLVMKLVEFKSQQLSQTADRIQKVLRQAFGAAIEFCNAPSHPFYVVTFVVAGGLKFDVVTTGLVSGPGPFDKFHSAATSYIADTLIMDFLDSNKLFRPLVLLCKHWAYLFTEVDGGGKRPRSYFIELYAMETIRKVPLGNDTSLRLAFMFFLELIDGSYGRVDVRNPNGHPEWISISGHPWIQFQGYASDTLRSVRNSFAGRAFQARVGAHTHEGTSSEDLTLMIDSDEQKSDCLVENKAHRCSVTSPHNPSQYFCLLADHEGQVEKIDFWQGDHRYVSKGEYTEGERRGEPCVVKWFKTGDVFEEKCFDKDLMTVKQAALIVNTFNCMLRMHAPSRPYRILVNGPGVWTDLSGPAKKRLVEPFLTSFKKFNSNTAMVDADNEVPVMQALSHFSYHITNKTCLLCDLQGKPPTEMEWKPTYILTDPVICSVAGEYGPTDLGVKGIENFFYYHKCNRFCNPDWSKIRGYPHFTRSWGSFMCD